MFFPCGSRVFWLFSQKSGPYLPAFWMFGKKRRANAAKRGIPLESSSQKHHSYIMSFSLFTCNFLIPGDTRDAIKSFLAENTDVDQATFIELLVTTSLAPECRSDTFSRILKQVNQEHAEFLAAKAIKQRKQSIRRLAGEPDPPPKPAPEPRHAPPPAQPPAKKPQQRAPEAPRGPVSNMAKELLGICRKSSHRAFSDLAKARSKTARKIRDGDALFDPPEELSGAPHGKPPGEGAGMQCFEAQFLSLREFVYYMLKQTRGLVPRPCIMDWWNLFMPSIVVMPEYRHVTFDQFSLVMKKMQREFDQLDSQKG
jgi:hypothetical protein